mmetsp:Transcript_318/g.635  ORF Transcript_318/g.635 Transcript_318/m.635 type:complete len:240 (+) Transcript_318:116-835(+)
MAHQPFLAIIHSKQFCTRQIKQSPINIPLSSLPLSIRFLQHRPQLTTLPMLVHQGKPCIARLLVIAPIDAPMVRHRKVLAKIQQQVIGGHGPTSEECVSHPTLLKVVGVIYVGENVDKEFTRWLEEGIDFGEQDGVVLHVLEHFNANHPIIVLDITQHLLAIFLILPLAHIACNHPDIAHIVPPFLSSPQNVLTLRMTITDGSNLTVWKLARQMQRHGSPSTSQIDNAHPILDLCTFNV